MATFNKSVVATDDDAIENISNGNISRGSVNNEVSSTYIAGLRFANVTIPQGATITSATLTVVVNNATVDIPDIDIYCQAADNADAFSASTYDISSRSRTTAKASWIVASPGTGSGTKTSSDISAPLQELVNRAGWSSGNAAVFILLNRGSSYFRFNSYDTGTAPKLDVTYTPAEHYYETITMTSAINSTVQATANAGAAMTLGIEAAVNNPSLAETQDGATLARMMEALIGGAMAMGEFVTLTRTDAAGATSLADVLAASLIARDNAALFDAFVGADAAMRMDQERAATFAHNVDMSAAVTFLLDAGMGFKPDFSFAAAMTLATARPFDMTGLAIAQAMISFINDEEIGATGDVTRLVTEAIELAIERDLTFNETAALQAAIALLAERETGITGLAAAAAIFSLTVEDFVHATFGDSVVEFVTMAAERAMAADASLMAGAFIELIESQAVDVDATAALWAMLTLATVYDVDTASMADVLERVGFVRVGQFQATGQAGILAGIELVAYQAILAGGVVDVIFTPRYVFIVDAERRQFIVSRDRRDFDVPRETREFKVKGV